MTQLIHPPNNRPRSPEDAVAFFAGPIQGAPDWQEQALGLLVRISGGRDDVCIANPRAPGPFHGDYNGQVDWELHNLALAARTSTILFWLALPDPNGHHPPGRAYAQTSRFELGEWVGRSAHLKAPLFVLGIEPGFTNERYLRRRIGWLWPELEIPDTLERTIELLHDRIKNKAEWPGEAACEHGFSYPCDDC
jgi:hypothetical protein